MEYKNGVLIDLYEGDQDVYELVTEYVSRYFNRHGISDLLMHLELSYNGSDYYRSSVLIEADKDGGIQYLTDWWDGEQFIKIVGISSVNLEYSGGVYSDQTKGEEDRT